MTEDGRACLVPAWSQKDDEVFLPFGSAVPFIVRPELDGHSLQGECYIHGAMNGEILGASRGESKVEEITLV